MEKNDSVNDNDPTFFDQIEPISDEDDADIAKDITRQELLSTLQTCKDSAPGPDGIPYSIIKLLWPLFGDTLKDA